MAGAAGAAALTPLLEQLALAVATQQISAAGSKIRGAAEEPVGGLTGYGLGGKVPSQAQGIASLSGVGIAGRLFGNLIKPLTTIPKALEDWGDSLLDARRNLMAFNGAIAGSILEAERRNIVRKMGEGRRVSGTTKAMSEALSDLKDEFQPIKDVIVNGFNILATAVLSTSSVVTKNIGLITPIVPILLWMQDHWLKEEAENPAFLRFIDDIKAGKLEDDADHRNLMGAGVGADIVNRP